MFEFRRFLEDEEDVVEGERGGISAEERDGISAEGRDKPFLGIPSYAKN